MAKEINRSLLEKVQCLLSNARLDKSFWAKAIVYASHLINGSTTIGGKTSFKIWFGKSAQDHGLLREFRSPTYFSAKDDKVTPREQRSLYFWVSREI